jgi:hypothetical protein
MFRVGIKDLFKRKPPNVKVQGRDKGSSSAYDYDNKTIQRMTAKSTQYTVCKNDEQYLTFDAMLQYID